MKQSWNSGCTSGFLIQVRHVKLHGDRGYGLLELANAGDAAKLLEMHYIKIGEKMVCVHFSFFTHLVVRSALLQVECRSVFGRTNNRAWQPKLLKSILIFVSITENSFFLAVCSMHSIFYFKKYLRDFSPVYTPFSVAISWLLVQSKTFNDGTLKYLCEHIWKFTK